MLSFYFLFLLRIDNHKKELATNNKEWSQCAVQLVLYSPHASLYSAPIVLFCIISPFPGYPGSKVLYWGPAPAPPDSTPRFQSAPAVVQRPGPV